MVDPLLWDAVRALLPASPMADVLDVLDVGGGTGGLAVPIAALGHHVTVVDPSPDALAALDRRLGELAGAASHQPGQQPGQSAAGSLVARQGDADDLALAGQTFDLVLCHGVLEHVDDPVAALAGVVAAARPGGRVSLVVAQRSAAVVAAALSGQIGRAEALLADPAGRAGPGDSLARRFDRDHLATLAAAAGLEVQRLHGLQALSGLVSGHLLESDPAAPGRLAALDARLAGRPDYAGLSHSLHLVGRRPG